jgi:prepilin-type N-terminal cleavage/methylation domain-containing protein
MKNRRPDCRGFTLVEIVVTLAIIMLLIGLSVAATQSLWHTRELQVPMAKLKEFARRARNAAIFEQRPYQVEITPHGVALFSMVAGSSDGSTDAVRSRGLVARYDWDDNVMMKVRRWNHGDYAELGRQVWIFERSGLCEPITARIQSEFGFIEATFNALDAHVDPKDEVSEIE